MSLTEIKEAVAELSEMEKSELRAFLADDMDEWDLQMQRDFAEGGKHHHVIAKIDTDIEAGRLLEMP